MSDLQAKTKVSRIRAVLQVGSAIFGLSAVTLLNPAPLGWFTYLYVAVGFDFSVAYAWALTKK